MVLSHSTLSSSLVFMKNILICYLVHRVKIVDFDVQKSVLETVHFISISPLKFM